MGARTRWLAGVLLTFVLVGAETRAGEPAVAASLRVFTGEPGTFQVTMAMPSSSTR